MIIVFVTINNKSNAKKLAMSLLKAKLVACANLINNVESMYTWKGKIETSKEVLLLLKTKKSLFSQLTQAIKKQHPYETPEIVSVTPNAVEKNYLNWIKESVC